MIPDLDPKPVPNPMKSATIIVLEHDSGPRSEAGTQPDEERNDDYSDTAAADHLKLHLVVLCRLDREPPTIVRGTRDWPQPRTAACSARRTYSL
jgi:hypothetical protein